MSGFVCERDTTDEGWFDIYQRQPRELATANSEQRTADIPFLVYMYFRSIVRKWTDLTSQVMGCLVVLVKPL